jgi:RNA polymerase sigma-70 factor (ECF subfamily)
MPAVCSDRPERLAVELARLFGNQAPAPERLMKKPPKADPSPTRNPDWPELVSKIRAGDPRGMEELYTLFSRGIRFYLCRQLGPQELDDKVHDTFLIVVQAIQHGELREPERLMGFVRTVVRRQVVAHIDSAVQSRKEQAGIEQLLAITDGRTSPEQDAIAHQREEIMEKVLRSISRRDREILTRFYLLGQSQEQICAEMKLTETQFRLLKSRAKSRFGELGKRKLRRRSLDSFSVRTIGRTKD